jgi:hypothetical protein
MKVSDVGCALSCEDKLEGCPMVLLCQTGFVRWSAFQFLNRAAT